MFLKRIGLAVFGLGLAAQNIVSTFAGTEWIFPGHGRPALDAPLATSIFVTSDPQGRAVFSNSFNHIVARVERDGTLSVIAGNGIAGFSGDGGPATSAALNDPQGLAYDREGNLLIADYFNGRVRKVSPAGVITTIAGSGNTSTSGDGGSALRAGFLPWRIALDSKGLLYIADSVNRRVRRIDADGRITTIAGTGQTGYSGEGGPALQASLTPDALAIDAADRVLVSEQRNYRVLRFTPGGNITTIAGTGQNGSSGDGGPATAARVGLVKGLAVEADGGVLVADGFSLRRIDAQGMISTIAGGGTLSISTTPVDPLRARLSGPYSVAVTPTGELFLSDTIQERVYLLASGSRFISLLAGNRGFKEVKPGTPATLAAMTQPVGLAVAPDGTLYYAEMFGNRIGRVDPNGTATIISGTGTSACCGDGGPAVNGAVNSPAGLALAPDGSLLIADSGNQKIRKITNGVITSIGGVTFSPGYSGDGGPATEARFNGPWAVAADAAGNIYVSDRANNAVRRIDRAGVITTYAGNGRADFSGDGGPANAASLNAPSGLSFNGAGELLIADRNNNRIRAVSTNGVIRTWAGSGAARYDGDGGSAAQAGIPFPTALASDARGVVFVSHSNSVVRRIDPNGTITTAAGNNTSGFSGDGGSPTAAQFNQPQGLAAGRNGELYIADSNNYRIRVVRSSTITSVLSPSAVALNAAAGAAASAPVIVNVAASIENLPFQTSVNYDGPAGGWLTVAASKETSPARLTLTASAADLAPGRYTATLRITTAPAGASNTVSVTLTVAAEISRLAIASAALAFSRSENSGPETQSIEVRNTGGGVLDFQAAASGGAWLTVSGATGQLRGGQPATVAVTANPAGLRAGTYSGAVTVTASGTRQVIPVTFSVRTGRASLLVTQAGLSFTAVAGAGSPTAQTIGILNTGAGTLAWRARTTTGFIRLGREAGTVNEPWVDVSELPVGVSPSGLAPGQHFGQIEITGDADNSPQFVTVLLTVLPEGSTPGPEVTPSSLLFVSRQGENPGSQSITMNQLGRGPATFETSRIGTWYEMAPGAGRAMPDAPQAIVVQPNVAQLAPGIRRGVVTIQVQENGGVQTVNLLSIVAPAAAQAQRSAFSCASPTLRVEATSLRDGFTARVGEAMTIEIRAADECGNLLTPPSGGSGAQVIVLPGNGDTQFGLTHVGGGVWRGTWRPVRAAALTRLGILALYLGTAADVIAGRTQSGKLDLNGTVLAPSPAVAPILTAGGVVHAASFESGVAIAPGSLITLYGARLADSLTSAPGVPLPSTLSGTEVRIGDRALPLLFTSDGQINAQIPYDLAFNTQHQITVKRGEAIAVPESLPVAAAQPGIFTKTQNGRGQGAIVRQDGVTLAEPGTAAGRGEVVIIYCSGLGPVLPAVNAGEPAPSSQLAVAVNAPSVSIGGQTARVLFAGLAPGFSGLYQINAIVPSDAPVGDQVEVFIESANQRSRTVSMAIR